MKNIVPYTKEIKFDGKLAEICSISLEPIIDIKEDSIEGNFIVSGEYKSHKVSVNKENFNYELPFSVDVTDNIIKDSINFEVTDFTYEVLDENILKVNIEFSVEAEEQEEIVEEKDERESFAHEVTDLLEEKEDDIIEKIETNNILDLIDEEVIDDNIEEERLDEESAELILDSAGSKEDEYTTYYIHIVKSGDTLESIISIYQTDLETIKNYNNVDNLNIGDKIIIPSLDE